MTGFTSEVVFKPSKKPRISPLLVGGTLNDGEYYIFNANNIFDGSKLDFDNLQSIPFLLRIKIILNALEYFLALN